MNAATVNAPVPLEVRTLGRLEVLVDGRAARFARRRAGTLLAWLALHGPASRDRIVVDVCEEREDARAAFHFKAALRALRAGLVAAGADFDPVPFDGGLYRLSERFAVRVDAWVLDAAASSVDAAALAAALGAYRGDFLEDVDSAWVRSSREAFHSLALGVALSLGSRLEVVDAGAAARAYRRAIALEPLSAEARDGLTRSLVSLGHSAEAALRLARGALTS